MTLKQSSPKCRRSGSSGAPASIRIRLSRAHRDLYPREDSIEFSKLRKEQQNLEYKKLRKLIPSVNSAPSVSKVTIINEAVRYIDQLHEQLMDKINRGLIPASILNTLPPLVPSLASTSSQQSVQQQQQQQPSSNVHHQTSRTCNQTPTSPSLSPSPSTADNVSSVPNQRLPDANKDAKC